MIATGIIRRVDDLGRIVIPREIRRKLNIKDGAALEIFTDKNCVIFKNFCVNQKSQLINDFDNIIEYMDTDNIETILKLKEIKKEIEKMDF